VPSTVFKMPTNYPPAETKQRTLAGMNTPDIRGTYGWFRYYTDDPPSLVPRSRGGGEVHDVYVVGNRVEAELPGPVNSLKSDRPDTVIPFQVFHRSAERGGEGPDPGERVRAQGEGVSGWIRVRFSLIPNPGRPRQCAYSTSRRSGQVQALRLAHPHRPGPAGPAPLDAGVLRPGAGEALSGPIFTKGLPADTSALESGVLDEAEFLHLDNLVYEEAWPMLEYELGRFDEGCSSSTSRTPTSASTCSGA